LDIKPQDSGKKKINKRDNGPCKLQSWVPISQGGSTYRGKGNGGVAAKGRGSRFEDKGGRWDRGGTGRGKRWIHREGGTKGLFLKTEMTGGVAAVGGGGAGNRGGFACR